MKQREEVLSAWQVTAKRLPPAPAFKERPILCLHRTADRSLLGRIFWKSSAPITRDCTGDVVNTLVETNEFRSSCTTPLSSGPSTIRPRRDRSAKGFIQSCDADLHHASLWALTKVPEMHPELRKHPSLPAVVKSAITI